MGMRVPSSFHEHFAALTDPRCPCAPNSRHLLMVVSLSPADNSLSANTRYNALISPPSEGALPWCRIFFSTSWC